MKRTTIAMPDELSELVEHEAKRQGVSVSEWIRRAIQNAILGGTSGPREIPWAGIFEDPDMVRGRDVDEALQETWVDDIDRDR
jgi:hypothetical protein